MPVHAYPRSWRVVAAILFTLSRSALLVLLVLVALAEDPPISQPMLARLLFAFALLPGLAAMLIRRAFAVDAVVDAGVLRLRGQDRRLEVPCASIERVEAWRVPLPGPGLSLWLRSGRQLPWHLQMRDPYPLLQALSAAGVDTVAAERDPMTAYSRARAAWKRGFWQHPVVKFGLFALGPGLIFFNAHQYIAYGGTFGQYYLEGPLRYLDTLFYYCSGVAMYLLLYASAWRAAAEAAALAAAGVAPSQAARVRRIAEIVCLAAFYAGVPALVAMRFLA